MDGVNKSISQTDHCDVRPASIIESLRSRKTNLERQLKDTDEALKALESNPEVARILHLVTKIGRL